MKSVKSKISRKTYKLSTRRIIELFLTPVISSFLIAFIIYTDYHNSFQISTGKVIAYSVILIVVLGPFFYLFYNHLNFALRTHLVFFEDKFEIIQDNKSYIVNISEIIEIIQYSTDSKYASGKLWWGGIMKWEVKTSNFEFVISSLNISSIDFKKHIKNEITYKLSYFPTL